MKKFILILLLMITGMLGYSQDVTTRTNKDPGPTLQESVQNMAPTINIPIEMLVDMFSRVKSPRHDTISFGEGVAESPEADVIPFFFPETMSWEDLDNPVVQGCILTGEYFTQEDLEQKVATIKVKRQMPDGTEKVEIRWVSEYIITIHLTSGGTLTLDRVRLICNYDGTATPPLVVPGGRYRIVYGLDDDITPWSRGGKYSIDKGLQIDYD